MKIKTPALVMPSVNADGTKTISSTFSNVAREIEVQKGVVATWDAGEAENEGALQVLGKDGKLKWIVNLAPQEKVTLTLAWEVTSSANLKLVGL